MCMECEKNISLKCIKTVFYKELEVFTEGEEYGAFTYYQDINENEPLYHLASMTNQEEEFILTEADEDDMVEYLKNEWFLEHFEVIKYYII